MKKCIFVYTIGIGKGIYKNIHIPYKISMLKVEYTLKML